MHLLIPHASALGDASAHTLAELNLPNLAELLGRLEAVEPPIGTDEYSANTPFELTLAALRGAATGPVPTAAWLAREHGLESQAAWALLTPIHFSVGTDQITALSPDALDLDVSESRAIFDSLAELWPEAEGWQAACIGPTQWLVAHERFKGLESASLDRVVQRSVDPWMPVARTLRTFQNEVQMLLHRNPLIEAREARGVLVPNSVWISGCGKASGGALPADVQIDERLRRPLLDGDWAAWAEAWRALDAGPLAQLLSAAKAGEPVKLTLCGERLARIYQSVQRNGLLGLWQRIVPPRANTAHALEVL